MGGSRSGGERSKKTNLEKYGPDFYYRIGKMSAGYKRPGSCFASMTPEKRREAGRKGGLARVERYRKQKENEASK